MIPVPWRLEPDLAPEDFQKIGQLTIRWSHIDEIIGHCLKTILRLNDDQAAIIVFPMRSEARLDRITELNDVAPLNGAARFALSELKPIMKGIAMVRNSVVHSYVREDTKDGYTFHLRSKDRTLTRDEIY